MLVQSRMTTRPEDFVTSLAEAFPHLKVCSLEMPDLGLHSCESSACKQNQAAGIVAILHLHSTYVHAGWNMHHGGGRPGVDSGGQQSSSSHIWMQIILKDALPHRHRGLS